MLAFDTDAAKQTARASAVGEARASHAAPALDAAGRHRGAHSLRRVADRMARPMWSMLKARARACRARSLCEPAARRGRGRRQERRRSLRDAQAFDSVTKQMVAALQGRRPPLDAEALLRRGGHASRRWRRRRAQDLDQFRSRPEPAPAGDRRRRSSPCRPRERAHPRQGGTDDARQRQRPSTTCRRQAPSEIPEMGAGGMRQYGSQSWQAPEHRDRARRRHEQDLLPDRENLVRRPIGSKSQGDDVQFEVLGFGHHRAEGLKGGMITHLDRAETLHSLGRRYRRAHGRGHR